MCVCVYKCIYICIYTHICIYRESQTRLVPGVHTSVSETESPNGLRVRIYPLTHTEHAECLSVLSSSDA